MNQFEQQIKDYAAAFPYPPTPEINWRQTQRPAARRPRYLRLALIAALLLMAVPLYAALDRLQIGSILVSVEPTPFDTAHELLRDLPGGVSLDEARERFPAPLMLPAVLPEPDQVFIEGGGNIVISVWLDEPAGEVAWMLYQMMTDDIVGAKSVPDVTGTNVNDVPAIWMEDPHVVTFDSVGQFLQPFAHLVEDNLLLWASDDVTYRLETPSDIDAAREVAESLR